MASHTTAETGAGTADCEWAALRCVARCGAAVVHSARREKEILLAVDCGFCGRPPHQFTNPPTLEEQLRYSSSTALLPLPALHRETSIYPFRSHWNTEVYLLTWNMFCLQNDVGINDGCPDTILCNGCTAVTHTAAHSECPDNAPVTIATLLVDAAAAAAACVYYHKIIIITSDPKLQTVAGCACTYISA